MKYKIDSETLTDIADAIRAKTGDSASMTPLEMPDEIASISGGGDNWSQYIRRLTNTFYPLSNTAEEAVPSPLELDLPNCEQISQAFNRTKAFDEQRLVVILHLDDENPTIKQLNQALYYSNIRDAKITGDLSGVTTYNYLIQYATSIEKIDAELDFTSVTSTDTANIGNGGGTTLTFLRYKANTLSYSQTLTSQRVLDEDSLISIANGLNETATGQTLTLYSTRKTLCNSIMGDVGMDSGNNYHVFTKNTSGATSLTNFITSTKGWTLA